MSEKKSERIYWILDKVLTKSFYEIVCYISDDYSIPIE